ncbi:Ribokinase-like protein [Stereum hirsutum FP-91666 SS1]|uniref:Ribokinase-like protein n=1 Tax=Stereum hirsutum (strain FP-91666) TaxID=721885 RepID=UPI000440DBED|nr:Ribokinase-like protein [Stereum hirsutum FP-91666 SS1]EIM88253.1 Ribokinase-like protein [Stereum hirsutum FP-91666 SS1]
MSFRDFVTLGLFIIDEFKFLDENGEPTGRKASPSIGGGGTFAAVGARIWLPADQVGGIVDKGHDFPSDVDAQLKTYGEDMWLFRENLDRQTTRELSIYRGEHRGYEYLSGPRIQLSPRDLIGTRMERPKALHFCCSPARAKDITSQIKLVEDWHPTTIWEPLPNFCIPEYLPALTEVLPAISILSPNAEESFELLSLPSTVSKSTVEHAATKLLDLGVGADGTGWVIIRSGGLGAYVASRGRKGEWIEAFWKDQSKVVDVTGAGNSFLGGLGAGLALTGGDVVQATFHATISAAFTIEQQGLPRLTSSPSSSFSEESWNDDTPRRRLEDLRAHHPHLLSHSN